MMRSRAWARAGVGEEALAIGLFAALSARGYVEALAIAANHDGDSDSTASIAGQLWGAWKGLDGIPHDWIVPLDIFRPALRLAAEMRRRLDSWNKSALPEHRSHQASAKCANVENL